MILIAVPLADMEHNVALEYVKSGHSIKFKSDRDLVNYFCSNLGEPYLRQVTFHIPEELENNYRPIKGKRVRNLRTKLNSTIKNYGKSNE